MSNLTDDLRREIANSPRNKRLETEDEYAKRLFNRIYHGWSFRSLPTDWYASHFAELKQHPAFKASL